LYELETQAELASGLGYLTNEAEERQLEIATDVAKLINGLLGVLEPEGPRKKPAN